MCMIIWCRVSHSTPTRKQILATHPEFKIHSLSPRYGTAGGTARKLEISLKRFRGVSGTPKTHVQYSNELAVLVVHTVQCDGTSFTPCSTVTAT